MIKTDLSVFLYGGLMHPDVMDRVGLEKKPVIPCTLADYEIEIAPWVTILPRPRSAVFGLVMDIAPDVLQASYAKLAVRYFPQAVAVSTEQGLLPAVAMVAEEMEPQAATADHIGPLLEMAERLRFPEWYLTRIRSFLP